MVWGVEMSSLLIEIFRGEFAWLQSDMMAFRIQWIVSVRVEDTDSDAILLFTTLYRCCGKVFEQWLTCADIKTLHQWGRYSCSNSTHSKSYVTSWQFLNNLQCHAQIFSFVYTAISVRAVSIEMYNCIPIENYVSLP
jgi:hypothetical protein